MDYTFRSIDFAAQESEDSLFYAAYFQTREQGHNYFPCEGEELRLNQNNQVDFFGNESGILDNVHGRLREFLESGRNEQSIESPGGSFTFSLSEDGRAILMAPNRRFGVILNADGSAHNYIQQYSCHNPLISAVFENSNLQA